LWTTQQRLQNGHAAAQVSAAKINGFGALTITNLYSL
jgi:hypothetical protein